MTSVARTCSVDGCERPRKAKGYCDPHWQRHRSGRSLEEPIREVNPGRSCSEEGCNSPYLARGYCSRHYQVKWKFGKPRPEPKRVRPTHCIIPGCNEVHESYFMCSRHGRTARNYKMSSLQLINAYAGGCEMCGAVENLHIDHNHTCCKSHRNSCGKCVRGVLCGLCNTAIGNLRDDVAILQAGINYLSRNRVN